VGVPPHASRGRGRREGQSAAMDWFSWSVKRLSDNYLTMFI
jgi:hypothetical protein